MSWKVENTAFPIVEVLQSVAPKHGLWYYVTVWVFPNMSFALEKLYESPTVVVNLCCNPIGLVWFYGFCHMQNFEYNISVSHRFSSLLASGVIDNWFLISHLAGLETFLSPNQVSQIGYTA